jgi:hypothetical protein
MLCAPGAVSRMAQRMEPHAEAVKAHATRIANSGFEASHAGRDYQEHGRKPAAGVDTLVSVLHSWSEASRATTQALRTAVTTTTQADQDHASQIGAVTRNMGAV